MNRQLPKFGSQGALGGELCRSRPFFRSCSKYNPQKCNNRFLKAGFEQAHRDRNFRASPAASAPTETLSLSLWSGSDEFTCCNDRIDAPPLPLPSISEPVRVVIVRHGQSTWNAEGRIQGSTDLSVLTEKGIKQAEKTRDMLSSMRFSWVFQSPLTRARQTADVVMRGREAAAKGPAAAGSDDAGRVTLASLREIDLYHFQGLLKHEGKALYGEQYLRWQKAPHTFELDGHAPVRELWHRASLAWQALLQPQDEAGAAGGGGGRSHGSADPRVILVVAHNAINQALVATALGLQPSYFRRLPQNNAALSVFDLEPASSGGSSSSSCSSESGAAAAPGPPPRVTLSCLNQSPDNPFKNPDKVVANVVLITPPREPPSGHPMAGEGAGAGEAAVTAEAPGGSAEEGRAAELRSLAAVLSKLQVTHVLAGHCVSAATVAALLEGQPSPPPPSPSPPQEASAEDQQWLAPAMVMSGATVDRRKQPPPPIAAATATATAAAAAAAGLGVAVEFLPARERAEALWERAVSLTAAPPPGDGRLPYGNVLVVLDEGSHVGVIWAALGLGTVGDGGEGPRLRVSPGGLSVIEFAADPRVTPAMVRCINNTAHVSAGAAAA